MTLNFLLMWTEELSTRANPQSAWRDWVGTNGPTDLTSIDPYIFEYRTFSTLQHRQVDRQPALAASAVDHRGDGHVSVAGVLRRVQLPALGCAKKST
jgi:hypothetical protein